MLLLYTVRLNKTPTKTKGKGRSPPSPEWPFMFSISCWTSSWKRIKRTKNSTMFLGDVCLWFLNQMEKRYGNIEERNREQNCMKEWSITHTQPRTPIRMYITNEREEKRRGGWTKTVFNPNPRIPQYTPHAGGKQSTHGLWYRKSVATVIWNQCVWVGGGESEGWWRYLWVWGSSNENPERVRAREEWIVCMIQLVIFSAAAIINLFFSFSVVLHSSTQHTARAHTMGYVRDSFDPSIPCYFFKPSLIFFLYII